MMQHDLDVTLDELVRDLRKRAGLSQKRLAQMAGLSNGMIGRVETGDSNLSEASLSAVATAVNATTAERRRLSRARDRAAERLSTKKARRPTDIGPATPQPPAVASRRRSPGGAPEGSASLEDRVAELEAAALEALPTLTALAQDVKMNVADLAALVERVSALERRTPRRRDA